MKALLTGCFLFVAGLTGAQATEREAILAVLQRSADWQLAHLDDLGYLGPLASRSDDKRGWVQGVFYIGLTALADHSMDPRYADAILKLGREQRWLLGDRLYHADDHLVGQSYLWAYRHSHDPVMIRSLRRTFDRILAWRPDTDLAYDDATRACQKRWCWADALFMSPAAWLELSNVSGNGKYRDYADKEFWATTAALYDPSEHLFYRDSRFVGQSGEHGEKIFWSRGNGWVLAGLARIIADLPTNQPDRARYVRLYRDMARRIIYLQKPDGNWPVSLLYNDPEDKAESSGTGLLVYGLAWGVKAGLLDSKTARPAVERGWQALLAAIQPDGKLGWVQPIGANPHRATAEDSEFYGVGALLLAGSAILDLQATSRR